MRRVFAIGITVLVSSLGLAGSGDAQPTTADSIVQTPTTVQAVDCDSQQVTLAGAGVSSVVQSTLGSVVHVNGAATPFCSLAAYVGAPATAWIMPRGGQMVLVRLDVTSTVVPSPPAAPASASTPPPVYTAPPSYTPIPSPYTTAGPPVPVPVPSYTPSPSAGAVILGTVLIGGLVYLLIRSVNGSVYRLPYTGTYQQPAYSPYVGSYRTVPAYTYGQYRRCKDGTWSQWCR